MRARRPREETRSSSGSGQRLQKLGLGEEASEEESKKGNKAKTRNKTTNPQRKHSEQRDAQSTTGLSTKLMESIRQTRRAQELRARSQSAGSEGGTRGNGGVGSEEK